MVEKFACGVRGEFQLQFDLVGPFMACLILPSGIHGQPRLRFLLRRSCRAIHGESHVEGLWQVLSESRYQRCITLLRNRRSALGRRAAMLARCDNDESSNMTDAPILIRSVEVLSDDWAILKRFTFDYRRRDGSLERQGRQTYDRGHGAGILPPDPHPP